MSDKLPVIFDGGRPQFHMDRPAVPRPSAECMDLVKTPDRAPATFKIARDGHGSVIDGAVKDPAATLYLETKQKRQPDVGAVIATPVGAPSVARDPSQSPQRSSAFKRISTALVNRSVGE